MLSLKFFQIPFAVDVNEQALRAADAGWETARWTFWLVVATIFLVVGAGIAAFFAWKTWKATKDQLGIAKDQLKAAQAERDNSNEQLQMVRDAALKSEAVNVSAWLIHDRGTVHCYIRNGNGGPIYDVKCVVSLKKSADNPVPSVELQSWQRPAVGPAAAPISGNPAASFLQDLRFSLGSDTYVGALIDRTDNAPMTAQGSKDVKVPSLDDWKIWDLEATSTGIAVEVNFRDSRGNLWWRDWEGKLGQIQRSTDETAR